MGILWDVVQLDSPINANIEVGYHVVTDAGTEANEILSFIFGYERNFFDVLHSVVEE